LSILTAAERERVNCIVLSADAASFCSSSDGEGIDVLMLQLSWSPDGKWIVNWRSVAQRSRSFQDSTDGDGGSAWVAWTRTTPFVSPRMGVGSLYAGTNRGAPSLRSLPSSTSDGTNARNLPKIRVVLRLGDASASLPGWHELSYMLVAGAAVTGFWLLVSRASEICGAAHSGFEEPGQLCLPSATHSSCGNKSMFRPLA